MLKSYNTTLTAETTSTLFTVESNHEVAVLAIEIFGGENGGVLTFVKNDGTKDVFTYKVSIEANDFIVFDHRQFFESGYSFKVTSDTDGVMIGVNADNSLVE